MSHGANGHEPIIRAVPKVKRLLFTSFIFRFVSSTSPPHLHFHEPKKYKRSPMPAMFLQSFQTKNGNPLPSVEAHLGDDAESRFVLWDDIQKIGNVHHLLQGERVCCFAVNQEFHL